MEDEPSQINAVPVNWKGKVGWIEEKKKLLAGLTEQTTALV